MDDVIVEHVLVAVEQVPAGRVVAYGDIAALVGVGPREVGSIMRAYGGNVTWWRVTNAAGDLPAGIRERAFAIWAREGIEVKPNGLGCRIAEHRVDRESWARAYAAASAGLPSVAEAVRARRR